MESSSQDDAPVDIHAPFTRVERLQQLADIDHDIASLLELTGKSIQSLGKQNVVPPPKSNNNNNGAAEEQPQPQPSAEEQTQAFRDAMNKFLSTLHSVDALLKRQILGLDEAGIISLPRPNQDNKDGGPKDRPSGGGVGGGDDASSSAGALKPALEPDGLGKVGSLDVGWLNSRSNQVEREMEAELWTKARRHLESLAGGGDGAGDTTMTG
ncbi:hypothetical protein VPNG_09911 [Cytospora leucostoma]|uniref:Mediator of RNA polymerase II transcription subunit 11 n=1 Tax=Cytospora leucostoma TaxID=1230097 RepID=A0A423VGX7_9PEZI|nr:hypothetical protein VPNG_09911 [Cytospora leucostoma]